MISMEENNVKVEILKRIAENPYEKISTKETQLRDYQRRVTRVQFTEGHTRGELLRMINSSMRIRKKS